MKNCVIMISALLINCLTPIAVAGKPMTLMEITDFALNHNPETKLAWAQAKAAAANVGIVKSSYYPDIDAGGGGQFSATVFTSPSSSQTTYGPNMSLNYLLFDWGTRSNDVLSAKYALVAADLNQNAVIQSVILQVQQAYYQVLGQQALVKADKKSVTETTQNLKVSQALRENGLATIGDVYQAEASLAQAQLNLQTAQGNYQTTQGQLATMMGLPVTEKIELVRLTKPPQIQKMNQKMSHLLETAKKNRPDLLAAQAQIKESQANLAAIKASNRPTLTLNATAEPGLINSSDGSTTTVSLTLSTPLFTGFFYTHSVKKAQADVIAAQATRDQLDQQIQFQVWEAYFNLDIAAKSMISTQILLKSSQQANQQAVGQYKNGVGDILSVLTTQTTLANARVQSIQAQLDWYVALAQLTAAIGTLSNTSSQDLSP